MDRLFGVAGRYDNAGGAAGMKVLTAAQMRAVDRQTIERGVPGIVLMENAGLSCWHRQSRRPASYSARTFPGAKDLPPWSRSDAHEADLLMADFPGAAAGAPLAAGGTGRRWRTDDRLVACSKIATLAATGRADSRPFRSAVRQFHAQRQLRSLLFEPHPAGSLLPGGLTPRRLIRFTGLCYRGECRCGQELE